MKTIVLDFDGLLDDSYEILDNKTPLEYAKTPNFDKLVQKGSCGLLSPYKKGVPTYSVMDLFLMLGYSRDEFPGISVLRALGEDLELSDNAVYIECTFVSTIEDNYGHRVVDRASCDLTDKELSQLMSLIPTNFEGYEFNLKTCADYGCVLSMTDKNGWISDKISDSDPYYPGRHVNKISPVYELCDSPGECKRAKSTAEALNKFLLRCHKILENHEINIKRKRKGKYPINFLITRFPGKNIDISTFYEKYGLKALSISNCRLAKGFSRFVKVDYLLTKDLSESVNSSIKYLDNYDLMYVKCCRISEGQIKDPVEKAAVIEEMDACLDKLTDLEDVLIIITSKKLSKMMGAFVNSGNEYSLIVSGKNVRKDNISEFTEKNCYIGPLRIEHNEILNLILNYMDKALLYGLRPGGYLLDYIPNDEDIEHLK
ncbi:2,3-diphosphopglycerate-independent phosphoglycerate mutase [Methanococcus maripaludis]|uniref:2,3-diphosphopglycerate-independent phosphoglycerate mutase n=1 Tax=Methanococcus maripaludis TaxID=39152 RepID=A0A7J9NTM5_METMI|nr:phosphoglycerate mutase [Methanococcus maripaludis]MBA2851030.1 2,3-diphosphopglycerate-independent phosphoglycerate mutase [Methanococcus maripaludis]